MIYKIYSSIRKILPLILILVIGNVFGQNILEINDSIPVTKESLRINMLLPDVFKSKLVNWDDLEIKTNNSIKDSMISRIINHKTFEIRNVFYGKYHDDFHVIDFNMDGKLDLIYTGRNPGGIEKDNYAFFVNDGDSLYLIFKKRGEIISLEKDVVSGYLKFEAWEGPCCAEVENEISYFSFYTGSDISYSKNVEYEQKLRTDYKYVNFQKNYHPNFKADLSLIYLWATHFPDSVNLFSGKAAIINSNTTYLETNPYLKLLSIDSEIINYHDMNATLAILEKGNKVKIMGSEMINNESYSFIICLVSESQSNKNLYIKRDTPENIIGWVKTSSLSIIP